MIHDKAETLRQAVSKQTGFVAIRGSLLEELADGLDLTSEGVDGAIRQAIDNTGGSRATAILDVKACQRLLGNANPTKGTK